MFNMARFVSHVPLVCLLLEHSFRKVLLADSGQCENLSGQCSSHGAASEQADDDIVDTDRSWELSLREKSVEELRRIVLSCGLSHSDCFEKDELRARALDALRKNRSGTCLPQKLAKQSARSDTRRSTGQTTNQVKLCFRLTLSCSCSRSFGNRVNENTSNKSNGCRFLS